MSLQSAPRWMLEIDKALKKDTKSTTYQLATIEIGAPEIPPTPHVRSLVHRGFLSLRSATQTLLLTTTDIRTPKTKQIAQNARVEIAWWIPGTQEQFRIAGKAYVYPSHEFSKDTAVAPEVTESDIGEGEKTLMEVAAQKLAWDFPARELGGESFDWEAKRVEVFEEMSGHMKASWARPIPGTPLPGGYSAAKAWPETLPKLSEVKAGEAGSETKGQVEYALKNFALVVIDPLEVDYVELGTVPNQRTKFHKESGGEGKWVEEIVVP